MLPIVVRQNATVRGHQLYLRIELQEQPIGEQAVYTVLIEREQPVETSERQKHVHLSELHLLIYH